MKYFEEGTIVKVLGTSITGELVFSPDPAACMVNGQIVNRSKLMPSYNKSYDNIVIFGIGDGFRIKAHEGFLEIHKNSSIIYINNRELETFGEAIADAIEYSLGGPTTTSKAFES